MKLREKIKKFFSDCYGIDELGKFIWILLMIWGIAAALMDMPWIAAILILGIAYSIYRILNFENRKYARVFLCKKCGRYIRIPKKKGRVEVTCPKCGNKEIHRT